MTWSILYQGFPHLYYPQILLSVVKKRWFSQGFQALTGKDNDKMQTLEYDSASYSDLE